MKILIENVSILTAAPSGKFISKGYLYIDKGIIVALGEGPPPPELEFADYVINGNYSVAMPGFVVGIGDIFNYIFRFKPFSNTIDDVIPTLSTTDIQALASVTLASLALNGATSIVTHIRSLNHKMLSGLAIAANECWIRVRLVFPTDNVDISMVEDAIRYTIKSLKDPEALSKGIISFGFYIKRYISRDLIDLAKSLNAKLYIDSALLYNEILKYNLKDIAILIQFNESIPMAIEKITVTNVDLWRHGVGLTPLDPLSLNPRIFIQLINRRLENPRDILSILCYYNPLNLDIGMKSIESGSIADVIVLDFSKPPAGPIPMMETNIVKEVMLSNYAVDTMLISGELVLDQGVVLNVGDRHIKKAQSVFASLGLTSE